MRISACVLWLLRLVPTGRAVARWVQCWLGGCGIQWWSDCPDSIARALWKKKAGRGTWGVPMMLFGSRAYCACGFFRGTFSSQKRCLFLAPWKISGMEIFSQKLKPIHRASIHPIHFGEFSLVILLLQFRGRIQQVLNQL